MRKQDRVEPMIDIFNANICTLFLIQWYEFIRWDIMQIEITLIELNYKFF